MKSCSRLPRVIATALTNPGLHTGMQQDFVAVVAGMASWSSITARAPAIAPMTLPVSMLHSRTLPSSAPDTTVDAAFTSRHVTAAQQIQMMASAWDPQRSWWIFNLCSRVQTQQRESESAISGELAQSARYADLLGGRHGPECDACAPQQLQRLMQT